MYYFHNAICKETRHSLAQRIPPKSHLSISKDIWMYLKYDTKVDEIQTMYR